MVRACAQYNRVMLPTRLYRADQVRELDRLAIEEADISGYELMTRAAQFALGQLRALWPAARTIGVACGAGNNAGDGYVLARLAAEQGLAVHTISVTSPDRLRGDAATAYEDFAAAGLSTASWPAQADVDVWIDAMLGTGLDRELAGAFADCVRWFNGLPAPVMALDIPTGLHADSGEAMGAAVVADATSTFIGLKQGLFLANGKAHVGTVSFSDLGIPGWIYDRVAASLRRLDPDQLSNHLPARAWNAHKGSHGTVIVVAGGPGMGGAARLAGEAALRSGAGLVKVVTYPDHATALAQARPELIVRPGTSPDVLDEMLASGCSCLLIGPGLGRFGWSKDLLTRALAADVPTVIDADGLNLLAGSKTALNPETVVTPHPREAARLLDWTTQQVQSDRKTALGALADTTGATVVLKGSGTLVSDGLDAPWLCAFGNPGMATAGTGDVLAGVIAGLIAQFGSPALAARIGVLVHALAGDSAAESGERGMLASDLLPHVRRWLNQ